MIRRRYTISSRSIIPSLSLLVCLLSIYLSTTTTVYAEQRSSTTTTTTNPQLHSPPPSNVQTTILPLSTNIPNDIPPNNKDKVNEVNNNGGDEWKLLDGEFSTNTNNKDDTKRTNDDNIEQQQQSIISDASSALAANYISKANYNPPVGSVANGNDSANNGNTGNNNSGGGWFGKILGKDKQNDSNTAKVSQYELILTDDSGDLLEELCLFVCLLGSRVSRVRDRSYRQKRTQDVCSFS